MEEEDTEKYLKITSPQNGSSCYVTDLESAEMELGLLFDGGSAGEPLVFEIVYMTKTEYEGLPEFTGW